MHQGNTTFNIEEIERHIRTYRSLLKSAGKLKIEKLVDSHFGMKSILHAKGNSKIVDVAAFIYVLLRLPSCMSKVKNIVLGQSFDVFKKHHFSHIDAWQEVEAPGRRRKMYFDGDETLVVYIASVTDVDDLITLATAFQIEWNKFHQKLAKSQNPLHDVTKHLAYEDLSKIQNIWGADFEKFLQTIKDKAVDFTVELLSGSYVEYAKATKKWWQNIQEKLPDLNLNNRPLYFVSSNTHSITNLLTRFVLEEEITLIDFLYKSKDTNLIRLWKEIESGDFLANRENFLYYLAKKYGRQNPQFLKKKRQKEHFLGIHSIPSYHYLDINTQVIELKKLAKASLDQRLGTTCTDLKNSEALLINIDYPLGWAAYQVLTEIGQNAAEIRGIYIMGKAATLNGQIGDILLPSGVFDQHTKNLYAFDNALKRNDFNEIFKTGSVLDNQKTACTKGTFLENETLIKNWFREGYTIIEMETGPYLNAIYEFIFYNRYVENQFLSLIDAPFEVGIAHYASDTPYSKAKNLGVKNLSYEGVEPTYAISLAIIKKIIERENKIQ